MTRIWNEAKIVQTDNGYIVKLSSPLDNVYCEADLEGVLKRLKEYFEEVKPNGSIGR